MAGFLFGVISFIERGGEVDIGMYMGGIVQCLLFWTCRSPQEGGGDVREAFRRSVETLHQEGALQTSSMVVLDHR